MLTSPSTQLADQLDAALDGQGLDPPGGLAPLVAIAEAVGDTARRLPPEARHADVVMTGAHRVIPSRPGSCWPRCTWSAGGVARRARAPPACRPGGPRGCWCSPSTRPDHPHPCQEPDSGRPSTFAIPWGAPACWHSRLPAGSVHTIDKAPMGAKALQHCQTPSPRSRFASGGGCVGTGRHDCHHPSRRSPLRISRCTRVQRGQRRNALVQHSGRRHGGTPARHG
jgi:hypothetical protein